jgi:dihydrolipoamide dehydrogenase
MVVGEFTQETDLVVIGGGPAGYTAAFRAAELGISTVIVDSRDALGGVCLHEGCIPSKTLLHIAQTIRSAERAAEFGVKFAAPKIDFAAVKAWKGKTVGRLASGLESLCKKHGVDRIQGRAHFEDSRNIGVLDGTVPRIRFRRALIATGSTPRAHEALHFDGRHVMTPGEALAMDKTPQTLLVVGNDYMAVELAEIFAALGSEVTLANPGSRLLPEADGDLVRPLAKRLEGQLTSLRHSVSIERAATVAKGVEVTFREGPTSKSEVFEVAVICNGHVGNTRGLQLEKTQARVDDEAFVQVDAQMRTADPRIFAAGDVTGGPLLADKAIAQGRVAAEVLAGHDTVFDARAIPVCIFTDPQLAWCGFTEEQAKAQGVPHAVVKVPWGASGRAVGMGRAEGITKIIYEPESKRVLGVGLCGLQVCEMISECALALEMGAVLTDLAATIHPHPTLCELLADAARQVE